ncbi:MAG: hypothetical protein ACRD9L_22870, partial [Bryobacteraceae bacterium]
MDASRRNLIASGLSAAAVVAFEELNANLTQWLALYPPMLLAGRVLTVVVALFAFYPWGRGAFRKWIGAVIAATAFGLFEALDHVLESGAYAGLDRNSLAKSLPLLYAIAFGSLAWTLKGLT